MTIESENLKLKLYDREQDASENFLNLRDDLTGTGDSNMKKIDEFAGDVNKRLDNISIKGEDGSRYRFGVDDIGVYIVKITEVT